MTTEQRLSAVEDGLRVAGLVSKKVLTFDEAVQFTGLSRSYLYKLTSQQRIPVSRPTGKLLYFDREELEAWLLQNRASTVDEIEAKAQHYCYSNRGRG